MQPAKPQRRLPLREMLTDAEKRTRDLANLVHITWLARAADLRDLSRPLRRRSHYPTVVALLHAVEKLVQASQEAEEMLEPLQQELEQIRDHARRERLNRT
jgi:C4-dicarboxylate-specific signal transduction histidine kinase